MAESFPSAYVDPKTGEVRRLGNIWDVVESDGLLKAADYALTFGKMAVLAPFMGVAAIVAPVAALIYERAKYNRAFNHIVDHSFYETKEEGEQYDMTKPSGQAKFDHHFGDIQPTFGQDYLKMVKMAGLKEVPAIIVRENMFDGWGPFRKPSEYNAGAISRTDGTHSSIEIGQGVIEQMTPGELRAIIGHEITHLALGHTKDRFAWMSRRPVNRWLNGMLIAGAALSLIPGFPLALPVLPALALAGVSMLTGKCLESINSRRREELCDRGAAILCGGTKDLASGLEKLKTIGRKALEQQVEAANERSIRFGRNRGQLRIKEPGAWDRFKNGDHPSNERREKLLNAFEQKYHSFCEHQRALFQQSFNRAARRPAMASRQPDNDPLSQIFGSYGRGRHKPAVIILHRPGYGAGY